MTTKVEIPPKRAPELVQHLNEVINAIQDVNNGLAARLTALPNCPPEALLLLKEWSDLLNEVFARSDIFVSGLVRDEAAPLQ